MLASKFSRMDLRCLSISIKYIENKFTLHKNFLCLSQYREGNLQDVQRYVEGGLDPAKVIDVNGKTPLDLATE